MTKQLEPLFSKRKQIEPFSELTDKALGRHENFVGLETIKKVPTRRIINAWRPNWAHDH